MYSVHLSSNSLGDFLQIFSLTVLIFIPRVPLKLVCNILCNFSFFLPVPASKLVTQPNVPPGYSLNVFIQTLLHLGYGLNISALLGCITTLSVATRKYSINDPKPKTEPTY